jgi:serine/threonine protein kinase
LNYLHEKCRDCIIHCDIKPENILLDTDFCPKVADFGLAKLVGRKFSRVFTTMRGTRGYLAPEWILGVAITAKADVYSYGMMLFEFISGRRNSGQFDDGKVKFFPTWAASKLTEGGNLVTLLDPWLEGKADAEELTRICKVACWCIQDDEAHRPTMDQVVQILEGVLVVNMPPTPRSLQVFGDNQEHIIFFTEPSSSSKTQTSISTATEPSSSSKTQTSISTATSQAKSNNTSSTTSSHG